MESAQEAHLLGKLVWSPPDPSATRMDRFRRKMQVNYPSEPLDNYNELWQWSVRQPGIFWEAVWDETEVVASRQWDGRSEGKRGECMSPSSPDLAPMYPPVKWFPGARLNFAENMLKHCKKQPDRLALIQSTEVDVATGKLDEREVTYEQLWQLVADATRAMRQLGVKENDTVASYSANNVENLVAFLACSAIGAVWSSAAADFAPLGVLERLRAVRPKLLFSVNAVRYNGKVHDHMNKLQSVLDALKKEGIAEREQALEGIIIIENVPGHSTQVGGGHTATSWGSFLQTGAAQSGEDASHIDFAQLDFNHPLWILFSSGTTGQPKAITHRAGGMLLQFSKEHLIHGDMTPDDVHLYFTTTGWMMWNYLIGSLVSGATLVLFDGSPLKPPSILWDLAERRGVTVFGTSAAYLAALEKSGYRPIDHHPKLQVGQVMSTGSPLRPSLYPFILSAVGNVLISSITGGTDICSLFAGHNTALPVYAGEIQCRNLGMDIDVFVDAGKKPGRAGLYHESLGLDPAALIDEGREAGVGQEGDLVCKTPFPVQPLGFWRQPEEKYRDSYYTRYPGVWHHGDYVLLTEHGGLVMLGRSDGVLNPGGIRFGSSDLYELLEAQEGRSETIAQVHDSLAVALKTPAGDDEVVVLFLVVGKQVDEAKWSALVAEVKTLVRTRRSARHVPRFVCRVAGVPKTLNGKRVEVPVKKLINGAALGTINQATLQNPEVLPQYIELGEQLRNELNG